MQMSSYLGIANTALAKGWSKINPTKVFSCISTEKTRVFSKSHDYENILAYLCKQDNLGLSCAKLRSSWG